MSPHRKFNPLRVLSIVVTAALVFVADQFTKGIIAKFQPGESRFVIPHLLKWTYMRNIHGAFGLFGSNSALLIGLALLVLVIFWLSFRDAAQQSRLVAVAFGLILGGAVGNIYDRVHLGYVIDFIDFYRIWPNIFNLADSCITGGVILLLLKSFATRRHA